MQDKYGCINDTQAKIFFNPRHLVRESLPSLVVIKHVGRWWNCLLKRWFNAFLIKPTQQVILGRFIIRQRVVGRGLLKYLMPSFLSSFPSYIS